MWSRRLVKLRWAGVRMIEEADDLCSTHHLLQPPNSPIPPVVPHNLPGAVLSSVRVPPTGVQRSPRTGQGDRHGARRHGTRTTH